MRIKATTLEAHRFGVTRRGYDPAEVDAVIERLVDTLRGYEERTARLEARIAEADESAIAMRRMLVAAQHTHDELVAEGHEEADRLVAEATAAAEERLMAATARAEELVADAEEETARILAKTQAEAAERLLEAHRKADEIERDAVALLTGAHRTIEERLTEVDRKALDDLQVAEDTRADAETWALEHRERAEIEATAILEGARSEAAGIVEDASREATAILDEARAASAAMLAAAKEEKALLENRLAQLRTAVATAERELEALAAVALERARTVGELIDLEVDGVAALDPPSSARASTTASSGTEASARIVSTSVPDEGVARPGLRLAVARDAVIADPDGSGLPPSDRKVVAPEDAEPEGGKTIYQRRAAGLKRRLAAAED